MARNETDDAFEILDSELAAEPLLRFFREEKQPFNLGKMALIDVAVGFRAAAVAVSRLPRSPERTLALRALISAQDEAGRAAEAQT